jgi:POT family proton-dependent oligopeptide transporter
VTAPADTWPAQDGAADRSFFGHPKGLGYLLGAEGGFAFAYYGLQTMLTLYMTQALLKPGQVEHVWGFSAYRGILQHLYGPLTPLGIASQTFGLSQSLLYALPLAGGFIADRWLGQRRAVMLGFVMLTAAFALLVAGPTFLVALLLMILGVVLVKTSMIGQIGRLYGAGDDRRTRAFGLYLIALNTGSLIAPLVAGTLGERLGWTYGLTALASGMAAGALCYRLGRRHMPRDVMLTRHEGAVKAPPLRPRDLRIVGVLLVLIVLNGVFIGIYNQAWNVLPVWAEAHVERHILGFLAPVTWLATLDGLLTVLGTALAVRLWTAQDRGPAPPSEIRRITIGAAMAVAAFAVLALGAWLGRSGPGGLGMTPLISVAGFFLLIDFATPWSDTVTLTVVSRDAPATVNTTMIGVYYLLIGVGNFMTGFLGGYADRMTMPAFWGLHGAILGAALLVLLAFGAAMRRGLRD